MSLDAHNRGASGPPPPLGNGFRTIGRSSHHSNINKGNTFVLGLKLTDMRDHGVTNNKAAESMLTTALAKCAVEARYAKKSTLGILTYFTFTIYMLAAPLELVCCGKNGREDPATARKYAVYDLTRNVTGSTYHNAALTNLPAAATKHLLWTVLEKMYPGMVSDITSRMYRGINAATVCFNNVETHAAFVASKTMVIGSSCPRIFHDFDMADIEYEADRSRTLYAHVVLRNLFPMDLLRAARTKFGHANITSAYLVPANYNPHVLRSTGGLRFANTAARDAAMTLVGNETAGIWKEVSPSTILTDIAEAHACFQWPRGQEVWYATRRPPSSSPPAAPDCA
ncbi:hypothetical protein BC828DRAFT_421373, partial [Blastocladiella britannica]